MEPPMKTPYCTRVAHLLGLSCEVLPLWGALKHQKNNPKRMLSQKAYDLYMHSLWDWGPLKRSSHRYTDTPCAHRYTCINDHQTYPTRKLVLRPSIVSKFNDLSWFVWTLTVPICSFKDHLGGWIILNMLTLAEEVLLKPPCYYNAQAAPIVLSCWLSL